MQNICTQPDKPCMSFISVEEVYLKAIELTDTI